MRFFRQKRGEIMGFDKLLGSRKTGADVTQYASVL